MRGADLLLFPYRVDVPMARWPVANFIILAFTIIVSLAALGGSLSYGTVEAMVFDGSSISGLLGHLVLHADWLHLAGNMLFLWVFGNAVCAKAGNFFYVVAYVALGVIAGGMHMLIDGAPVIGASGAINGIVGMFLVWYPTNTISCGYLILLRPGSFSCSSIWMILLWLVFDIIGVALGGGGVAYWAHLAGFGAGFGLAWLLTVANITESASHERSLVDMMRER
jgi:membrane associated rhomboid family serine protease